MSNQVNSENITEAQLESKYGIQAPILNSSNEWIVNSPKYKQRWKFHYKGNADTFVRLWIAGLR